MLDTIAEFYDENWPKLQAQRSNNVTLLENSIVIVEERAN